MQETGGGSKMMTWIAVCVFSVIFFVVFVSFQPARELFCGRYDDRGLASVFSILKGNDPNCFRNFLSEYQTLVTGVLAVAAAASTVFVMVKVDKAAAVRHAETVNLHLRSETLRVERMLFITLPSLSAAQTNVRDIVQLEPALRYPCTDASLPQFKWLKAIEIELGTLSSALLSESFQQAKDLLDGSSTYCYRELEFALSKATAAVGHQLQAVGDSVGKPQKTGVDEVPSGHNPLPLALTVFEVAAFNFRCSLERLSGEYKLNYS